MTKKKHKLIFRLNLGKIKKGENYKQPETSKPGGGRKNHLSHAKFILNLWLSPT